VKAGGRAVASGVGIDADGERGGARKNERAMG
jgi:hypothetical protein